MDSHPPAPNPSQVFDRSYWLRSIAAAVIAAGVFIGVLAFGRSQSWVHAQSIGLASSLFVASVLQQTFAGRRYKRTWTWLLILGVLAAATGSFIHALLPD